MQKRIADQDAIARKLDELASSVRKDFSGAAHPVLIGIQRRGVEIARRLVERVAQSSGKAIPLGILDITFYRDDLSMVSHQPVVRNTTIPFGLDDAHIVLVDDVIFTGRTIRAALDALVDFGRPRIVRLLTLVDRGRRELPIQPDYAGWKVKTARDDVVHVKVRELDGEDAVDLSIGGRAAAPQPTPGPR